MAPKRVGEMLTEGEYRALKRTIAADSATVAEYEKLMKAPDCVRVVEDCSVGDGSNADFWSFIRATGESAYADFNSRRMVQGTTTIAEICYLEGQEWLDDERTRERDTCKVYIRRGTPEQVRTLLVGLLDALGPCVVQVLAVEDMYDNVLSLLGFDEDGSDDDGTDYTIRNKNCAW